MVWSNERATGSASWKKTTQGATVSTPKTRRETATIDDSSEPVDGNTAPSPRHSYSDSTISKTEEEVEAGRTLLLLRYGRHIGSGNPPPPERVLTPDSRPGPRSWSTNSLSRSAFCSSSDVAALSESHPNRPTSTSDNSPSPNQGPAAPPIFGLSHYLDHQINRRPIDAHTCGRVLHSVQPCNLCISQQGRNRALLTPGRRTVLTPDPRGANHQLVTYPYTATALLDPGHITEVNSDSDRTVSDGPPPLDEEGGGGEDVSPQRQLDSQPTSSKIAGEQQQTDAREDEEAVKIPDFTHLPPPWAQNCEDIWQEGVRHVRKPDGSVDNWDVANWIITRKGGVYAKWEELEEGKGLIDEMRRDSIDVNRIRAQQAMEAEERQRKEERRLANKRWFQPKGGRQKVNRTRHSDGSVVSAETSTSFGATGDESAGKGV